VGKEELAQGGGGQAAFKVGIVQIVAGEISELLGDVFVLAPGASWSLHVTTIAGAVLDQKVEGVDGIGKGKRSLVFQVFTGHVKQFRQITVAESWSRGVQDARSKKCQRMFKDGCVERVVPVERFSA
jgi:hypothetical protein